MATRRKLKEQGEGKKARRSKYESETVISIELSENRQCQIIYNTTEKEASVSNQGVESIDTKLKHLGVKPDKIDQGLKSYTIPKKWIKILRSKQKLPHRRAWIMTRMPGLQARMEKYGVELYRWQADYATYNVPVNWIRIKKPKVLSPEEKERRAELMKRIRKSPQKRSMKKARSKKK